MLVVLQVGLVFPGVTQNNYGKNQVYQWLTGSIVSVKEGSSVSGNWVGWLGCSWSWSSWQLLVEGDNLSHSLGVGVRAKVLLMLVYDDDRPGENEKMYTRDVW